MQRLRRHVPRWLMQVIAWLLMLTWIAYSAQRLWMFQVVRNLPVCGHW